MDSTHWLLTRASNGKLGEPAPDDESIRIALLAAARAPDHGLLRPFGVQWVRGIAREHLGRVFREALERRNPAATAAELDKEERRPLRAPLLFVVSARLRIDPKVPEIEQLLSAGAAAHAILLALHARGYAGMWRTGAPAYDPYVKRALGLGEADAIVGFLYAGTPTQPAPARTRPSPTDFASEWTAPLSGDDAAARGDRP